MSSERQGRFSGYAAPCQDCVKEGRWDSGKFERKFRCRGCQGLFCYFRHFPAVLAGDTFGQKGDPDEKLYVSLAQMQRAKLNRGVTRAGYDAVAGTIGLLGYTPVYMIAPVPVTHEVLDHDRYWWHQIKNIPDEHKLCTDCLSEKRLAKS